MVSVIAMDGPVASGKTVVGREVAQRLGFRYLDTGLMYRAMGWQARNKGVPLDDAFALARLVVETEILLADDGSGGVMVDGEPLGAELEHPDISRSASLVATVPEVRRAMVAQQRVIAAEGPIVMVGRDIGTVVLTDADLKVYITASARVRARRRWREIQAAGQEMDFEQVLRDTEARDHRDSTRSDSPLRAAKDAVTLDTGELTIEESVRAVLDLVAERESSSDGTT